TVGGVVVHAGGCFLCGKTGIGKRGGAGEGAAPPLSGEAGRGICRGSGAGKEGRERLTASKEGGGEPGRARVRKTRPPARRLPGEPAEGVAAPGEVEVDAVLPGGEGAPLGGQLVDEEQAAAVLAER